MGIRAIRSVSLFDLLSAVVFVLSNSITTIKKTNLALDPLCNAINLSLGVTSSLK